MLVSDSSKAAQVLERRHREIQLSLLELDSLRVDERQAAVVLKVSGIAACV